MKDKHIIIVCNCNKEIKDHIAEKFIQDITPNEIEKYEDDYFGVRDKNGNLSWDFLNVKKGNIKITFTESSETIRQINMAILKGSLIKAGKKIPSGCENIPAINKDEIKVIYINRNGEVKEIEVEESGFDIDEMDEMIEEINKKTEDMYYELKYGD